VPWTGKYDAIIDKKAQVDVSEKKFTSARKHATVSFVNPSAENTLNEQGEITEESEPAPAITESSVPTISPTVSNYISKLKQKKKSVAVKQHKSTFDSILDRLN